MEDLNKIIDSSSISQVFFQAVNNGSVEELREIEKWLIMRGKDTDSMVNLAKQRNSDNETALIVACQCGNLDAVKYLVEHCQADVEQEGTLSYEGCHRFLCRPLHGAVIGGNVEIVRYLVEDCKAFVNAKTDITFYNSSSNYGGNTPLHLVSFGEHDNKLLLIASCLVRKGADISIRNDDGNPVWATVSHSDMVKHLIHLGMNINDTNEKNDTVAHIWARLGGEESTEIVHLLLERGCDLLKNNDGMTPLQLAAIGHGRRPNHETFKTIFEHREQFMSRIDKVEAMELIGATSFLGDDFQNGMLYWRKAMELRFNTPNEPPLRKCFIPYSHYARLAFENQSEVKTLEELEELAFYNAEALRIQALMTYCRLLRTDSLDLINAFISHALNCWILNEGQQYIHFSMLLLEYLQSLENQLCFETAYTLQGLVMAFYTFNREGSNDRQLVNFNHIMPVFHCIANELKRSQDEDLINLKKWNSDGAKDILLDCVVQLTILLSSLALTPNETIEFKRSLHGVVSLKEKSSREGYNLLLLACSKSSFSFSRDELRYDNQFGKLPSADAIHLFLELGIDPNSTDTNGNTGFHVLAKNGQTYDSPAIRTLHEAGADLDMINYDRQTMADLMNQNLTRHPNHIFITPFEFPKLKCLAARVVSNECIVSFSDLAPLGLFDFVLQH